MRRAKFKKDTVKVDENQDGEKIYCFMPSPGRHSFLGRKESKELYLITQLLQEPFPLQE